MNKSIATRWSKALKSSRYKRGSNFLCIATKGKGNVKVRRYDALGVLCELAYNNGIVDRTLDETYGIYSYGGHNVDLPIEVMRWAGIKNKKALISSMRTTIADLSDVGNKLTDIADVIKGRYKEL